MKLFQKILLAVAVLTSAVVPARAQIDYFAAPRTLIVIPPQMISTTTSNFVVDIHGYEGIAKLDILSPTNISTNLSTVLITTSPDRTNWTALSNYAIASTNIVILTNNYYGSALPLATNLYEWPGTITTPVGATAGFTTKYTLPAPFTNSGSFVMATNGVATIGFNIQDAGRYLQISMSLAGTSTNSVAAVLTAKKQQE